VFADAFEIRKKSFLTHPTLRALTSEKGKWKFNFPDDVSEPARDVKNLELLLNTIKNATVENRQKWSGPRKCGLALLLFGGHVGICQETNIEYLDLLGNGANRKSARELAQKLIEFQEPRNKMVHELRATFEEANAAWELFQVCLRGLLAVFHAESV
jgi:hypothetical protein